MASSFVKLAPFLVVVFLLSLSSPAHGARSLTRGTVENLVDKLPSWLMPRSLCIPTVSSWVEKHEGRHRCLYENEQGDKAIGVNYNLEDDRAARKSELRTVLADYDKVINGKQCLNDVQISALLLADTKRKLDEVSKTVHKLDDLCCDIQAVLADLDWSMGLKGLSDSETFLKEIENGEWQDAASALRHTIWCVSHKERCDADAAKVEKGCSNGISVSDFVPQQ